MGYNLDALTLEDCEYLKDKKNIVAIINDGKVVNLKEEE